MYNTTIFSVARRCEAEPSKTLSLLRLLPVPWFNLTCEVAISPSASAQWLRSSRRPEWLAWKGPRSRGDTARGFVAR